MAYLEIFEFFEQRLGEITEKALILPRATAALKLNVEAGEWIGSHFAPRESCGAQNRRWSAFFGSTCDLNGRRVGDPIFIVSLHPIRSFPQVEWAFAVS